MNKLLIMAVALLWLSADITAQQQTLGGHHNADMEQTSKKIYCVGASKRANQFTVSAATEIRVKAREGTQLTIKENSLVDANGNLYKGLVSIKIKEFYKNSDIILNDLHTHMDDQLLQTGGMVHIDITQKEDGSPLSLKKGSYAAIQMPTKNADADMQLFLGNEQEDGSVNWTQPDIIRTVGTRKGGSRPGLKIHEVEYLVGYDRKYEHKGLTDKRRNIYPNRYTQKRYAKRQYYEVTTPQLGWINCDKLMKKRGTIELEVKVTGDLVTGLTVDGIEMQEVPKVSAFIEELPSLLRGTHQYKNGTLYFTFQLPKGFQQVDIVAHTGAEQNQLAYTHEIVNLNGNEKEVKTTVVLKRVEPSTMQQDLVKLDH